MNLTQLLPKNTQIDVEIMGLHYDSRQVMPGFLFLAVRGALTDGRLFIDQAIENGAVAVAYDLDQGLLTKNLSIPAVGVAGLVHLVNQLAHKFYGNQPLFAKITGVTGTNGKTTVAYQLTQAHQFLGKKSRYIGTLGQGMVNDLIPLANTTPDFLSLRQLLTQYQRQSVDNVCLEVSSHALAQQRVKGVLFEQAIFTNLTQDHLDYHQTLTAYGQAKAQLFLMPGLKYAIVNADDPFSQTLSYTKNCKVFTYGISNPADVRVLNWRMNLQGIELDLISPWGSYSYRLKCLGLFNLYNNLAVFTSLMLTGYSVKAVIDTMPLLKSPPGRMELINSHPSVIIDYAHTPDALENALKTLTSLKAGRLILVFGCGGERDRLKRPIMGQVASNLADIIIVTNDNPRRENPQSIIAEITQAIVYKEKLWVIENRKAAIEKSLELAESNDVILIAGKGHEEYQQLGKNIYPFSDKKVVVDYQIFKANLN